MEDNLTLLRNRYPELEITASEATNDPKRFAYSFYSPVTRTALILTLPKGLKIQPKDAMPSRLIAFYEKHQRMKDEDYEDEDADDKTTGNLESLIY